MNDLIVCSKLERHAILTANSLGEGLATLAQAFDSDARRDQQFIRLVFSELHCEWGFDNNPADRELLNDIVLALTKHQLNRHK